MKITVASRNGLSGALLDHCPNLVYGIEGEALFYDDVTLPSVEDKILINTNSLALALKTDGVFRQKALDLLGIKPAESYNLLYGFSNGKDFSDFIEFSLSRRFMNEDVGPKICVTKAVGLVTEHLEDAVKGFKAVKDFILKTEYRGQVFIGVDEEFKVCNFSLGHDIQLFALASEISVTGPEDIIRWCAGEITSMEFYKGNTTVLGLLVSSSPFPGYSPLSSPGRIRAPSSAERHIWRMLFGNIEVCFVTVHGLTVTQAKYRLWTTVDNMLQYSPDLQYRTDIGYGCNFHICQEVFKSVLPSEDNSNTSSQPCHPEQSESAQSSVE